MANPETNHLKCRYLLINQNHTGCSKRRVAQRGSCMDSCHKRPTQKHHADKMGPGPRLLISQGPMRLVWAGAARPETPAEGRRRGKLCPGAWVASAPLSGCGTGNTGAARAAPRPCQALREGAGGDSNPRHCRRSAPQGEGHRDRPEPLHRRALATVPWGLGSEEQEQALAGCAQAGPRRCRPLSPSEPPWRRWDRRDTTGPGPPWPALLSAGGQTNLRRGTTTAHNTHVLSIHET